MTRTDPSSFSSSPSSSTTPNSPTKKPAVIISEDGEIEQHVEITNETADIIPDVVTNINSPITSGTDIVLLPGDYSVTDVYIQTPQHKFFQNKIFIFAAFIVSAAILIFYFKSEATDALIANDTTAATAKGITESVNETDIKTSVSNNALNSINALKLSANLIIQDNVNDISLIESFASQWHQLNDDEKQQFSDTFWYERFSSLLLEKINVGNTTETVRSETDQNYANALLSMASFMGVEIPDNSSVDDNNLDLEADFENIFKEISSEIAKAELDKKKALVESAATNDQAIEDIAKTSTQGFSEPDLNYLLGRYATTYEFGSTEKLLALFSVKGKYKNDLKRNFNRVFSYSSNRNVEFSDLSWDFQENSIIGNGKYSAKIELNNDNGTRFVKANIQIIMGVKNKQLRISKLNFLDIKVTHIKAPHVTKKNFSVPKPAAKIEPEQTIVANTRKIIKPSRSTKPTAAELQDVITRFIGAYQTGNLKILESIFDRNAKTNDRNSLRDITQDYRKLFESTADRQLFIQNIKWTYKNNQAEGIGTLNTLIVPTGSSKASAQQGEIHIVARKIKNKVLITKLYHNINNQ